MPNDEPSVAGSSCHMSGRGHRSRAGSVGMGVADLIRLRR